MPESGRFSLWLVPDGAAADAYQTVIDRLAREHGGPVFPPHLTLFGSITNDETDALERAQCLAADAAPFTVEVDGIDVDTTYYQSLFATVRATDALLALRQAAERTFDAPPGSGTGRTSACCTGSTPTTRSRRSFEVCAGRCRRRS